MKTVRIPYQKYKNIIFVKKIDYDLRKKYKKVTYLYEIYKDKELIEEVKHKNNYPAIIEYFNNKICKIEYWVNGKLHREYGPSIIFLDRQHKITKENWYKNGIELDQNDIDDIKKVIDRRTKVIKVILKMRNKN